MTILIERYKGHFIYFHTTTCIYTCDAVGERNSFYVMCCDIDALLKKSEALPISLLA